MKIYILMQIYYMKIIIFVLIIIHCSARNYCYSICQDQACFSQSSNSCTNCPTDEVFDDVTTTCMSIAGVTLIVGSVDQNWVASQTPYIQSVIFRGTDYTSATSMEWSPSGFPIYEMANPQISPPQDVHIQFKLINLPAFYAIDVRTSLSLSLQSECSSSYINIAVNPFSLSYNLGVQSAVASRIFTLTSPSSTQYISLDSFRNQSNPCSYWIINDITFVLFLCLPFCSTCTSLQICTACGVDNSNNQLYLTSNSTTSSCTLTCSLNYYISSDPRNPIIYQCNVCDISCLYCSIPFSSSSCTECTINGGIQLYLTESGHCVALCSPSTYADYSSNRCLPCHPYCIDCFGPLNSQCTRCSNATDTLNVTTIYYLAQIQTVCSIDCPYGQYIDASIPNLCQICNALCLQCYASSINCTGDHCNSGLFFYNYSCYFICPDSTYPNYQNLQCMTCSIQCLTCISITNCTACQNTTFDRIITFYYKDANLNFCQSQCNQGQYISGPNICSNCDKSCSQCSILSNNCHSCSIGYYLDSLNSLCLSVCSNGFYGNFLNYICQPCFSGCSTCFGPTSTQCTTCNNATISRELFIYFLQPYSTRCDIQCPSGYFPNETNNICQSCQNGCVQCSYQSHNCSSCHPYEGIYFFFDNPKNSCVTVCPKGYFANLQNYICTICLYYIYNEQCIQICPQGTVGIVSIFSTCVICQPSKCPSVIGFNLTTTIINNGKNLQHRIQLAEGVSSDCTPNSLIQGLSIELLTGSTNGRLLLSVFLKIQSLTIDSNKFLTVVTDYYPADYTNAQVIGTFKAGSLISTNGIPYNKLSSIFPMNDPMFIHSYIDTYKERKSLILGATCVVLSCFLLLVSLFFLTDLRITHKSMSFIQFLQIVGLSRIRPFPFQFNFINILSGFSFYELPFLPNMFSLFIQKNNVEISLDSLQTAFGCSNFFINFGSIIQGYIVFQIILFIYYLLMKENDNHVRKYKCLQQILIVLWSVIILFGAFLCVLSTLDYPISSNSIRYFFSVLISFVIIGAYTIYYWFWVRKNIFYQIYKINNLFRLIGLLMLSYGKTSAFLFINFEEGFFIIFQLLFFKKPKAEKIVFCIQRLLCLIILNSTFLMVSSSSFIIILICTLSIYSLIITAYFLRLFLLYSKIKQNKDAEVDISMISHEISNSKINTEQNKKCQDAEIHQERREHKHKKLKDSPLKDSKTFLFEENMLTQNIKTTNHILSCPIHQQAQPIRQREQSAKITIKRVKISNSVQKEQQGTLEVNQVQFVNLNDKIEQKSQHFQKQNQEIQSVQQFKIQW